MFMLPVVKHLNGVLKKVRVRCVMKCNVPKPLTKKEKLELNKIVNQYVLEKFFKVKVKERKVSKNKE